MSKYLSLLLIEIEWWKRRKLSRNVLESRGFFFFCRFGFMVVVLFIRATNNNEWVAEKKRNVYINCYALFHIYCFIAVRMNGLNCVENIIEKRKYNANNLKKLFWKTIKIFNIYFYFFRPAIPLVVVLRFLIMPTDL